MEPKRIFLVDDHQMILDGIKAMFREEVKFTFVDEATDGLKAQDWINKHAEKIDLLITDVNIPGISGIELCRFVKHNYPHIRVLIISMYQNNAIITEALMADADGYLLKTGGMVEFNQAINRVMDGASYYSEAIIPIIWKEYQREKEQEQLIKQLTAREQEILQLIIQEYTSTEIADNLNISKKTVDNHRQNLLLKTNSKSTIGLVKFALKAGLTIQ